MSKWKRLLQKIEKAFTTVVKASKTIKTFTEIGKGLANNEYVATKAESLTL